jgi:phage shock protein A
VNEENAMSLFHRVSDILSANIAELIERYEDPELLLKQAVREMEESIRKAMEHAVQVVAHEKVLSRQLAKEESAATLWRERAETAVRRGDDHTAREALREKRGREELCKSLAQHLEETSRAGHTLRHQIESMRLRSEDAKRKLHLLAARQHAAKARQQLLLEFRRTPFEGDAFQKFERMCRKVERTEAEAEARADLSDETGITQRTDWQRDEFDRQIEDELAEMKGKRGT